MTGMCQRETIMRYAEEVEVVRPAAGAYDSQGRWLDQSSEPLTICASVQPATPTELDRVEEGRRTSGAIKLYTDTELRTAKSSKQSQPDRVMWGGAEYEVEAVSDWTTGGFFKVIALKVGV